MITSKLASAVFNATSTCVDSSIYARVHTCIHPCAVCVHVCVHACARACVCQKCMRVQHACTHARVVNGLLTYGYAGMYVFTHPYIYTYIHVRICVPACKAHAPSLQHAELVQCTTAYCYHLILLVDYVCAHNLCTYIHVSLHISTLMCMCIYVCLHAQHTL